MQDQQYTTRMQVLSFKLFGKLLDPKTQIYALMVSQVKFERGGRKGCIFTTLGKRTRKGTLRSEQHGTTESEGLLNTW